jgi:hypothetical protein
MGIARQIKEGIEYLGGQIDTPPKSLSFLRVESLFWGLWWILLGTFICVFCGQSSKFIYIDF